MTIAQDFLTQTEALKQLYSFDERDDEPGTVEAYLEQYPFLIPLLHEAYPKIWQYFPDADLYLEIFRFYDTGGHEIQLFADISPTCEPEALVEVLDRFGMDWWLDNRERAQGKIEIMVEYR